MRWRRTSPIGLEIDGPCLRAVQVRFTRHGWRVIAYAEVMVPDHLPPADHAGVVRGVLERQGFIGRVVHVAVPEHALSLDLLDHPLTAESAAGVRSNFARSLRCPADALEVCHWQTAALPGKSFAAALTHHDADALIRPLESVGLDVAGLFTRVSALGTLLPEEPHPLALVRCGLDVNTLTLFDGADILYHRTLDTPGGIAADQVPQLAAFSEELATTLGCVPRSFGGLRICRILVSGEPAETESGLGALNQRLGTAEPLLPKGATTTDPTDEIPVSRFDVALGLALLEEAT